MCVCVYVCNLSYPACNAHACPALKHPTAPFKKKKVFEYKIRIFISSTNFLWKSFHFKQKWARYDKKFILVFMSIIRYLCPILTKLEFSRHIFVKYSNIEFHENPAFGCRVVPCGRTDMTKPVVAFRNFATAPISLLDVHNARSTLDCPWAISPFTVTVCWILTVAFIQLTMHEIFALCYVPCVDRYFATFRENSSLPSSRVKQPSSWSAWPLKMGLMGCPETSVITNLPHLNPRRTMTSNTPRRQAEFPRSTVYQNSIRTV